MAGSTPRDDADDAGDQGDDAGDDAGDEGDDAGDDPGRPGERLFPRPVGLRSGVPPKYS